ncbi:MAG: hypothetical protein KDC54_17005 [Lewinella sp.]|nr:hypothetical protein [Lewinella sp.]
MDKRKEITKELRELGADRLADWPREAAAPQPPAGYFDRLADEVLAKAQAPAPTARLRVRSRRWLAVAAAVAVLVLASVWWLRPTPAADNLALDDIPEDAILAYIEDNITEFDTELLEDLVAETDDTWELPADLELSPEAVEQYLQDEDGILFLQDDELF